MKPASDGVESNEIEDEAGTLLGSIDHQGQTQFFNSFRNRPRNNELNFRLHEIGGFVQDFWKLKSNLTPTYGLRYE